MRTAPCAVDIISAAVTALARTAIFMRSPLRDPGASPAGNAPPCLIIENQMWGKCGIPGIRHKTGPTRLPGDVDKPWSWRFCPGLDHRRWGRLLQLGPRVPDQSGPFRGFDRNEGGE